jgi:cob(I)alamin adenosyltransferase
MKIYTKGGDKGKTSLLSGERVEKNHHRIEAYGCVDELNSFMGLLVTEVANKQQAVFLSELQHTLFNIGTHLAIQSQVAFKVPPIKAEIAERIEKEIDKLNAELPPLKAFILPGGSKAASLAHVCRSVCRRAERLITAIPEAETRNPEIVPIINRLSDYFFVLARFLNQENSAGETLWEK